MDERAFGHGLPSLRDSGEVILFYDIGATPAAALVVDIRQQVRYLGVGIRHYGKDFSFGTVARHPGSADSTHPAGGGHAWLGHFGAYPADFRGCAAGEPGVAISGPAPVGASGLDQGGMGRFRTGAAR